MVDDTFVNNSFTSASVEITNTSKKVKAKVRHMEAHLTGTIE